MKKILLLLLLLQNMASAAGFLEVMDGSKLALHTGLPFAGLLLSIAFAPIIIPKLWHKLENGVLIFWACIATSFLFGIYGAAQTGKAISAVILTEYIPFIAIISTLYTVSSSIRVSLTGCSTPWRNTKFMILGSILSSFIGTTGSALLLIRPLLQFNQDRHHKIHLVIFFIFMVANVGGCLTPLGDPPLFLGFLYGVHFFWPAQYLIIPFLIVFFFLVITFWMVDAQFHDLQYKEGRGEKQPININIQGKPHALFIPVIIGLVLFSSTDMGKVEVFGSPLSIAGIIRDIGLICVSFTSLYVERFTYDHKVHHHWGPIQEVMKVFMSIFISMIPITLMLKAGESGAFSDILALANKGGEPRPMMYFWLTGIFSGFLDNAPTYSLFFKMAGGNPQILMTDLRLTLEAISLGAVFFGAVTYIGNAPNFMVRAIAKQSGVNMPSFFGYMLWSLAILLPIFLGVSYLWFT